jgi:hypothetical protein
VSFSQVRISKVNPTHFDLKTTTTFRSLAIGVIKVTNLINLVPLAIEHLHNFMVRVPEFHIRHHTNLPSGTTLVIFGTISPYSSLYSVTLNSSSSNASVSSVTSTLSARSSFTQYNTSLFIATGLNQSQLYDLEVLNVDGGLLQLAVGGFSVAGTPFKYVHLFTSGSKY